MVNLRFDGDNRMKYFSVMTGIVFWALIASGSLETYAFPTGRSLSLQVQSSGNQKLTKNSKVRRTMKQSKLVPVSVWGGNGIRLSVGQNSLMVEYACASGEADGRLKMDERGNFKAIGVHMAQRPGPVSVVDEPERQPVRYDGRILGKTMKLRVTLIKNKTVIGDFELKRDAAPRLHRCL